MGPPKEIPASALFLKLMETPFPSEVVDFPRRDANGEALGRVRIRVLSMAEHDSARTSATLKIGAAGFTPEQMSSPAMREVTGDAIAKELISLACVTAEEQFKHPVTGLPFYGQIFRDARDVGCLMSDELAVLFNAYLLVQRKYGPIENNCDASQWIRRIKEGGSAFPLLLLDSQALAGSSYSLGMMVYTVFGLLESHWQELPNTLKYQLETYHLGNGSWLDPAVNYTQSLSEKLANSITLDDAISLSHQLDNLEGD